MGRNQIIAATTGLSIGLLAALTIAVPGQALADSPWHSLLPQHVVQVNTVVSPVVSGTLAGCDDSPWIRS